MARRVPRDRPRRKAHGDAGEAAIYQDRARRLGLSFAPVVDLGRAPRADVAAIRTATFAMSSDGKRRAYVAPDEDALPSILHWLSSYPAARSRLTVTTRSAIRAALVAAREQRLAEDAVTRLEKRHPLLSARRVVTAGQAALGLIVLAGVAVAAVVAPVPALMAANLAGAMLFFGVTALRLVAAGHAGKRPLPVADVDRVGEGTLPIYTILVPLRDEARIVTDLVAALDRIDWPPEHLDIKLLLEADDDATIAAARQAVRGPPYEIVLVPPVGPRTKPKALAYALPLARGEFVTVYDAEDRPHPAQLREAFAVFSDAPPDLACLQSPLVIDNEPHNWLSRSFAIEYAALFDAILPTLAVHGMPLPLGGTSNHFRREALEDAGGWDPYNVTEDADLGIRLARLGYRSGTLDLPTFEDAPTAAGAWIRQRTRWLKGWMQTWLVHTRRPLGLAHDLGVRGFLGFNLISTGLIVSSLVYPIYLVTLIAIAIDPFHFWSDRSVFAAAVFGLNAFNIVAGYMAMAILGRRALRLRGRQRETRALWFLPVYWLLASLASYRALAQLFTSPHRWEKTPHRPRRSGTG